MAPAAKPATLHRWLSVAIAAAIVLTATGTVGARTIIGRNVTVTGVVVDARTHRPVSGVAVTAAEPRVRFTTGADGRFHLGEVRKGTPIRAEIPNYTASAQPATGDLLRVTLDPIPVMGKVTSTFTGKGLAATISGKEKHATQADGTFRTFGVGPGDKLTISAFGHEDTTITIGPDRRVAAALKLGRVDPKAVLKSNAGYGFVSMPSELIDGLRAEVAYSDPEFARHLTGLEGTTVVHGGESIAYAFVMAMEPGFAALPFAADAFYAGVAEGTASIETIKIGDTVAKKMRDFDGMLGYAWQSYSAFVFVFGEEPKSVEAFVKTQILGETASA